MVFARSCALTAVGTRLATWLDRKEQTVRQQWREFCDEADAKRGLHRQALAEDLSARLDHDLGRIAPTSSPAVGRLAARALASGCPTLGEPDEP
jgi:hypothetical protein